MKNEDAWLREVWGQEAEDDADAERYPCRAEPHPAHWSDEDLLWCPGYPARNTDP